MHYFCSKSTKSHCDLDSVDAAGSTGKLLASSLVAELWQRLQPAGTSLRLPAMSDPALGNVMGGALKLKGGGIK